ncbi:MAG: hypothetical protein ABSG82_02245 [Sedimentisphaerales bacterium]
MAEKNTQNNPECKSELHSEHLCYIVFQNSHLSNKQEYKSLVENPQFKCTHCGRVAGSDKNLCKPDKL